MKKGKGYYLIARSRETNLFQIVPINGSRECSLEEIDLYTLSYKNALELEKELQDQGTITGSNIDFFIARQRKERGKSILRIQEILYNKQDAIKPIIENSMKQKMERSQPQIDYILDAFASLMESNSVFREQVLTGKTSVYPMYVKYFIMANQKKSQIKYNDGGWGRKSYPLIRSIVEAMTRSVANYASMSDQMYRDLIKEKILMVTDSDFNPDQMVLPDFFENLTKQEQEEKLLEVLLNLEQLPIEILSISENGEASLNTRLFIGIEEKKLDRLKTSLPQEFFQKLYDFLMERNRLDSLKRGMLKYQDGVKQSQKKLLVLLQNPKILNCAYEWCQLYNTYQDAMIGDVHGKRYKIKQKS